MEDRKARIAALRARAGRAKLSQAADDSNGADDKNATREPVLQVVTLTNSSERPSQKKQKGDGPKNEESVIDLALRQARAEAKQSNPAMAHIEDLAPKKVNADLKREIQPKLDKLEKRTQKAIVSLLRERLEREAAAEIDE